MRTGLYIITLLMHVSAWFVRGYSMRYYDNDDLSDRQKNAALSLHGIFSFGFAFAITNNVLVDVPFFSQRFAENTLWLIGTAFMLLVIVSILVGSLFTKLYSVEQS
ncbi:MAG: hypothetical protein QM762_01815 [Chryseolinea sp.]